jgi:hypothetical protein
MQLNIKEFLEEAEVTDALYPGKRVVKSCRQAGQYKSHCIVIDWRNPDKIRIELKAGLSGKQLEPKELKYYPVSFQSPTYVDIELVNDNEKAEDEDEGKSSGKSSGGGKQPKKSLKDMASLASEAFGSAIEGKIPEIGKIVDMMIMGKEIAAESFGNVMGELAKQIQNGKVVATDLMAKAGKFVTKYTPPSFMKPAGNEDASYSYNREKNADIGYIRTGPS